MQPEDLPRIHSEFGQNAVLEGPKKFRTAICRDAAFDVTELRPHVTSIGTTVTRMAHKAPMKFLMINALLRTEVLPLVERWFTRFNRGTIRPLRQPKILQLVEGNRGPRVPPSAVIVSVILPNEPTSYTEGDSYEFVITTQCVNVTIGGRPGDVIMMAEEEARLRHKEGVGEDDEEGTSVAGKFVYSWYLEISSSDVLT